MTIIAIRAALRAGVGRSVSGGNVLAGMNATLAGARYDVGPDPIPAVFSALQPAEPALSIELVGTMGEPNFNQLTGIRVNRAALLCRSCVHPGCCTAQRGSRDTAMGAASDL